MFILVQFWPQCKCTSGGGATKTEAAYSGLMPKRQKVLSKYLNIEIQYEYQQQQREKQKQ